MEHIHSLLSLIGRVLISAIFIVSGGQKLMALVTGGAGLAGIQGYMTGHGLPGYLLPVGIAVELGGGLLILLGIFPRLSALALAGFCLVTAVLFHNFWAADAAAYQGQFVNFMKNISIAGGLLMLSVNGTGHWGVQKVGKFEGVKRA